jgi:hypothetical protein
MTQTTIDIHGFPNEGFEEKVDIGEEYNDTKHVNGLKR